MEIENKHTRTYTQKGSILMVKDYKHAYGENFEVMSDTFILVEICILGNFEHIVLLKHVFINLSPGNLTV
jgi:hypothetical protein